MLFRARGLFAMIVTSLPDSPLQNLVMQPGRNRRGEEQDISTDTGLENKYTGLSAAHPGFQHKPISFSNRKMKKISSFIVDYKERRPRSQKVRTLLRGSIASLIKCREMICRPPVLRNIPAQARARPLYRRIWHIARVPYRRSHHQLLIDTITWKHKRGKRSELGRRDCLSEVVEYQELRQSIRHTEQILQDLTDMQLKPKSQKPLFRAYRL